MTAEVSHSADAPLVTITADGGTRRERGARIAAALRKLCASGDIVLTRYYLDYDETYGFLPRTTAKYRVTRVWTNDGPTR